MTAVQTFDVETGGFVCLDEWVGKLQNVTRQVTVRLPDGARSFLFASDMYGMHSDEI